MDEFTDKIQETEKQISNTRAELDALAKSFAEVAGPALEQSLVPILKEVGKAHPDVSNKVGPDAIAALVSETKKVAPQIAADAVKRLQSPNLWFHNKDASYYQFHQNDPDHRVLRLRNFAEGHGPSPFSGLLESDVRSCRNPLGDLLEKKGFPTRYGTSAGSDTDKHPLICQRFKWSEEMKSFIAKYGVAFQRLWKLQVQLSSLKQAQSKNNAAKLWDSIE